MRDDYERSLDVARAVGSIASSVAMLVLALASVGLFGVASHAARTRMKEIGIRLALGARSREAVRGLLRPMVWAGGIGTVLGVSAGAVVSRIIAGPPFHLDARDPAAYAGAASVLFAAAAIAVLTPVWRALRSDPLKALRQD
jgi:ABC-type antimicrobial peptide transport system permease subunit